MRLKTFKFSIVILTIILLIFTTSTILINIPNANADGDDGGGGVCWDGCELFHGFLICCMAYKGWETCYTPAPLECILEDFGCNMED